MSDLVRMSITMDRELADRLDSLLEGGRNENRSEFIRDMIRCRLVEREWEQDQEVLGTITIVYDHHSSDVNRRLTHLQHEIHDSILATTHVHLTHELCAEVIIARGKASGIKQFADAVRQQKGILHTAFSPSTLGNVGS